MLEILFIQEVKEKRLAASGARHKASRGRRAVSVRTPSDFIDGRTKAGRAYKGASECRVYRRDPVTGELVLVRVE